MNYTDKLEYLKDCFSAGLESRPLNVVGAITYKTALFVEDRVLVTAKGKSLIKDYNNKWNNSEVGKRITEFAKVLIEKSKERQKMSKECEPCSPKLAGFNLLKKVIIDGIPVEEFLSEVDSCFLGLNEANKKVVASRLYNELTKLHDPYSGTENEKQVFWNRIDEEGVSKPEIDGYEMYLWRCILARRWLFRGIEKIYNDHNLSFLLPANTQGVAEAVKPTLRQIALYHYFTSRPLNDNKAVSVCLEYKYSKNSGKTLMKYFNEAKADPKEFQTPYPNYRKASLKKRTDLEGALLQCIDNSEKAVIQGIIDSFNKEYERYYN